MPIHTAILMWTLVRCLNYECLQYVCSKVLKVNNATKTALSLSWSLKASVLGLRHLNTVFSLFWSRLGLGVEGYCLNLSLALTVLVPSLVRPSWWSWFLFTYARVLCFVIQPTKIIMTHTQPFYSPLGFCLGLPGWAGTRKVKPIWIYWSKR